MRPSQATLTIWANDAITFNISAYTVAETVGTVTLTVRLNAAASHTTSVSYATTGGTATPGSDYVATSGTLTFNPGETSKTFTVTIVDDALKEPNETIVVTLNSPVSGGLGSPSVATITILAND